jgi:hypothetical protein
MNESFKVFSFKKDETSSILLFKYAFMIYRYASKVKYYGCL